MSLYRKESMDDSSGIDDRWRRIKDKRQKTKVLYMHEY